MSICHFASACILLKMLYFRHMRKEMAGLGVSLALLAGCGGAEDKPKPVNTGVEKTGVSIDGLHQDKDWELVSIVGVGESELIRGDKDLEATFLRFNFRLGETAVSCLVAVDSGVDFPNTGFLDPRLCFKNANIETPLTANSN